MDNILATIAIIVALVSSGFVVHQFSDNDPDSTHLCESNMMLKFCDHLSLSEKTCYPQSDSRVGSKLCSEGWISLDGFIDEEIVSPEIKDDSDNDKICCPINSPCYKMVGTGC